MEDDDRELLRRLFVVATELIDNAHKVTIAGQSSTLAAPDTAASARPLLAVTRDIAIRAEAAMIVASMNLGRSRIRAKRLTERLDFPAKASIAWCHTIRRSRLLDRLRRPPPRPADRRGLGWWKAAQGARPETKDLR